MQTEKPLRARLMRLALAGCLILGACGGDGDPETDEPAPRPTRAASDPIPVIATDYAYGGIPSQMDAGKRLTLSNYSSEEVHEIAAFKLPGEEDRPAAELTQLPAAQLEQLLGGPPTTVIVALPQEEGQTVEGDGTLRDAGRYLFLCFVPTGADPAAYEEAMARQADEPPNVAGGPPHFTQGMFAEATVR